MLDRDRFPIDEWSVRERAYEPSDAGRTETVFALGNGYLGLRGNHPDPAASYEQGTFVNGFHETWPIRHAESAHGFAELGQTIVNVPDAKPMELAVDGERFSLDSAAVTDYERELDLRDGVLRRSLTWDPGNGVVLRVEFERAVSFTDRHLAVQRLRVTRVDDGAGSALVSVASRLVNRQDELVSEDAEPSGPILVGPEDPDLSDAVQPELAEEPDPRRAERFSTRVLIPEPQDYGRRRIGLTYRTVESGLGIAAVVLHDAPGATRTTRSTLSTSVAEAFDFELAPGETAVVSKYIAYFDGEAAELAELTARACEAVDRAEQDGVDALLLAQRAWLADFWDRSDVEIGGQPETQQAVRWCLFQLAQATARAGGRGVAAKGVTGSGYSGHYFWDSEIYVLPFLSYTAQEAARSALRMRVDMLPAARRRAAQLSERGALFPWRTITGEEASAYYPAGTAQFHIDADVCFAVAKYVRASGDLAFLADGGIDIAVETARMWAGRGFWRGEAFHIHGVTGPDEYTAVVNDNLYTNAMARFTLRYAVAALDELGEYDRAALDAAVERLGIADAEVAAWERAAAAMHIGFDAALGVHPQDASFLGLEMWDFQGTPRERYPLLLHFHPLVIYRHQVLKQADTVLALFLLGDEFTDAEKLADFEYYEPLTTGDSTLSGAAQAILAAEVGYGPLALEHFAESCAARSISRTSTGTRPTGCMSPRPAGCGPRS